MSPFLTRYVIGWCAFCVIAAVIAIRSVRLRFRDVVGFLRAPWKIALFVPAIVFTTFAGHFTDDETWDVISGGGMAILTALTSWWAIGTAVLVVRKKRPVGHLVVAIAVMLFSSSWFYDGYLLLRDGAYTERWLGNLMLSPTIYLCAGLVSNLEMHQGKLAFAFSREDWPHPAPATTRMWPILLASVPLVFIAGYFLIGFVGWHF